MYPFTSWSKTVLFLGHWADQPARKATGALCILRIQGGKINFLTLKIFVWYSTNAKLIEIPDIKILLLGTLKILFTCFEKCSQSIVGLIEVPDIKYGDFDDSFHLFWKLQSIPGARSVQAADFKWRHACQWHTHAPQVRVLNFKF